MAVSALDINETNPWSRVQLSEFMCIQTIREVLRRQIQMSRVIVSRATIIKPSKAVLKGTSWVFTVGRAFCTFQFRYVTLIHLLRTFFKYHYFLVKLDFGNVFLCHWTRSLWGNIYWKWLVSPTSQYFTDYVAYFVFCHTLSYRGWLFLIAFISRTSFVFRCFVTKYKSLLYTEFFYFVVMLCWMN